MATDCQAIRVLLVLALVLYSASELVVGDDVGQPIPPKQNSPVSSRKLLPNQENPEYGRRCRCEDIQLYQGPVTSNFGLPTYMVQVINLCPNNCTMYNVHINCGWFSTVHLINPNVFKRIGYNDCLLNDGGDFKAGEIVSFTYYNSFMTPLSIASVNCR